MFVAGLAAMEKLRAEKPEKAAEFGPQVLDLQKQYHIQDMLYNLCMMLH